MDWKVVGSMVLFMVLGFSSNFSNFIDFFLYLSLKTFL